MAEPRRLSFDPIAEAERQWGRHGWPDQAPGMAVVTSIMRLQQIFLSSLGGADAVLRPLGLTFARYEVEHAAVVLVPRRPALGQDRRAPAGQCRQRDQRRRPPGGRRPRHPPIDCPRRAGPARLIDGGRTAACLGRHRGHERTSLHGHRRGAPHGPQLFALLAESAWGRRGLRIGALESSLTLK